MDEYFQDILAEEKKGERRLSITRWAIGLTALALAATGLTFSYRAQNLINDQKDFRTKYENAPAGSNYEAYKTNYRALNPDIEDEISRSQQFYGAAVGVTLVWGLFFVF